MTDISGIEHCSKLKYLDLNHNQITDFSPLVGLKLTILQLVGKQISDLGPLAGMRVDYLVLDRNQISDLGPLAGVKVKSLLLGENQISDIDPLAGLKTLRQLGLSSNQISEIGALVQNRGLGKGDRVYLDDKPLSSDATNVDIPILTARGVSVTH